MSNTERKDFLVYAFSDENWEFYYIGKGIPKRPYSRNRKVERPLDPSHIHILDENLDEKTAYEYEKLLISLYGRKGVSPGGKLLNSTDGGGGTSGYTWSSEKLEKISGKNHHSSIEKMWYHRDHGLIIKKTSNELKKMFPEENLSVSALNRLSSGKARVHKNWIYIKEEEIDKSLSESELRKTFNKSYYEKKIQLSNKIKSKAKRGKNNPQHKERNWCHIKYGFVKNKSCSELIKIFSDTEASKCGLSRLALGKIRHHRGWIFIEKNLTQNKSLAELKKEFSPNYALSKIEEFYRHDLEANRSRIKRGEQNPMYNKKGDLHPSFGMNRSEKTKTKISEKARKRFTRRNWFHPIYGRIDNALVCELVEMFPEQKLQNRNLSSVGLGNRKTHKGWTCLY